MKKKIKFILALSLIINVLCIASVSILFFKVGGIHYFSSKLVANNQPTYLNNPDYIERTNLFNGVKISTGSTVFIGDSITQKGLWSELFPNANIVNRGINSDTTEGVKNRLNDIIKASPKKIFIMIGINDLYAKKTPDEIIANYKEILNQIKTGTPETQVFVQSILPVNNSIYFAGDRIQNDVVMKVNDKLKLLSREMGFQYVDVNSKVQENGQLLKSLTIDGIHLSGKGYNIWKNTIKNDID